MRPPPPQKPFDYTWFSGSSASSEVQRSKFPHGASMADWPDANETFYLFEGGYYLNGFLYKEVAIESTLDTGNVVPTIEQVSGFGSIEKEAVGRGESKAPLKALLQRGERRLVARDGSPPPPLSLSST